MAKSFPSRSPTRSPTSLWLWLALAAGIVLADQFTKTLIVATFDHGEALRLTSFFNLTRQHNPGAAFSLLADAGGWQRWFLSALALAASAFIIWLLRTHHEQILFALSITAIMGGAIGNLVDRLLHGHVIDMLDFHFRWLEPVFYGGHFPTFNLADAAITLGAIGIVIDEIRRVRRSR